MAKKINFETWGISNESSINHIHNVIALCSRINCTASLSIPQTELHTFSSKVHTLIKNGIKRVGKNINPQYREEPFKFLYALSRECFSLSADAKRKTLQKHKVTNYDIEADLAETKKMLDIMLKGYFKNELYFQEYCRLKQILAIVSTLQALEAERCYSDHFQKLEVLRWGIVFSYRFRLSNALLKYIQTMIKFIAASKHPNNLKPVINSIVRLLLLETKISDLGVHATNIKDSRSKNLTAMHKHIAKKVFEEGFIENKIITMADFQSFLKQNLQSYLKSYLTLHSYTDATTS